MIRKYQNKREPEENEQASFYKFKNSNKKYCLLEKIQMVLN
jgi:hypothetical protein